MEEAKIYETKGSGKTKLIILVVGVVALVAILVGGWLFFNSKSKLVFTQSYDYLTKAFKTSDEDTGLMKLIKKNDKIKYTTDMNIKFNPILELGIEDIDLKLELHEDKKSELSRYYFDSSIDKEKLLDLDMYLKDNKMYLTMTEIMEKYYYQDFDYVSAFGSTSTDDLDLLLDSTIDSIEKVITNDKFDKEEVTTNIDGKEVDCTKLSLDVTEKLLAEIITKVIEDYKDNDEIMEILTTMGDVEKDELIEEFDNMIEDMKESTDEVLFVYNIYYKGVNSIKKLEIVSGTSVLWYTANDGNYNLAYVEDEVEQFSFAVEKEKEDYNISFKMAELTISGKYTEKGKESELVLTAKDATGAELIEIVINGTDVSDTEFKSEMTIGYSGVDILTMTINGKYEFGQDIKEVDLSNATNIDDMSQDEANKIMENLENHEVIGPLINSFSSLMGSSEYNDTIEISPSY